MNVAVALGRLAEGGGGNLDAAALASAAEEREPAGIAHGDQDAAHEAGDLL